MPSNEALELIESVLTSVNEADRWQYRYADIQKKKKDELEKQIAAEKKKVEYYGKDPSKLKKLEDELSDFPEIKETMLKDYRKGTVRNKEKLNPSKKLGNNHNFDTDEVKSRHKSLNNDDEPSKFLYNPITKNFYGPNTDLSNKQKAMLKRIDKRTKAFDTTHLHDPKHEAAQILIEALDTLLSE